MNFYDSETNIIDYIRECNWNEIVRVFSSCRLNHILYSIKNDRLFNNWIDNSGEEKTPPDFYNDKLKLMLEVMRVDDYMLSSNCPNALESKIVRKLEEKRRENNLPSFKEQGIKLLVIPNMNKASDNNYETYVDNFSKIVGKHIKKIKSYRKNHQSYKLGFIIFDESTGYIIPQNPIEFENLNYDDTILASLHYHWLDKNLVNVFINEDIEYVIWVTPFKNIPENGCLIPSIILIDVKKYKKRFYKRTIDYTNQFVTSIEKF